MKQDAKLIQKAFEISPLEPIGIESGLHKLVHDVQNCLHVIGIGLEILGGVRDDDAKFAEISAGIDHERREAVRLLREYLLSTRDGR